MQIYAEILTIGDEILYGQIQNTNTHYISQVLSEIGVKVRHHTTVGDEETAILTALQQAHQRADVILMTGGLGPTKDDITKKTLCKFFNTDLVIDEGWLKRLEAFFTKRGRPMLESNRQQAAMPRTATLLENRLGTAPGIWQNFEGKIYVSMAGVPHEMEGLMQDHVLPRLREHFTLPHIVHKVIHTVAIGESFLAEKISDWEEALPPHIRLAYLPHHYQVRLRLTGIGKDRTQLETDIEKEVGKVMPLIEKYVFGFDKITLEEAIGQLLLSKNATVASAESCTGGYVAHSFTKIAGSSKYFKGGVVAYTNELKQEALGVNPATLEAHTTVSEETAKEMATNVRLKFETDYSLATTGYAGPDGGTPEQPVGTVWIACASANGVKAVKHNIPLDRLRHIYFTTVLAIDLLRKEILGIEE
jgi:nicotinamide-nucleotide amidase